MAGCENHRRNDKWDIAAYKSAEQEDYRGYHRQQDCPYKMILFEEKNPEKAVQEHKRHIDDYVAGKDFVRRKAHLGDYNKHEYHATEAADLFKNLNRLVVPCVFKTTLIAESKNHIWHKNYKDYYKSVNKEAHYVSLSPISLSTARR